MGTCERTCFEWPRVRMSRTREGPRFLSFASVGEGRMWRAGEEGSVESDVPIGREGER